MSPNYNKLKTSPSIGFFQFGVKIVNLELFYSLFIQFMKRQNNEA